MVLVIETVIKAWLENKYLDWQQKSGGRRPLVEFANYLGFSEAIVSLWMNGKRKPSRKSAELIAQKLGPEIFDILGLARPERVYIPVEDLPEEVRGPLQSAVAESVLELSKRGLSSDSPEGLEVVIKIFGNFGFTYSRTIKE